LVQAALSNNISLFNTLLENGADINSKGQNDRTPLLQYLQEIYLAKIEGNDNGEIHSNNDQVMPMVKLFLEKGADVNAKDNLGENILFYVIRGNYMQLVDFLIQTYKCDINTTNEQGETPLFIVAQNYPDSVSAFLEKGANPKVTDKSGRTPAVAAVEMGNMETFDLLENAASMVI
jgi:ankyrin repeat protein